VAEPHWISVGRKNILKGTRPRVNLLKGLPKSSPDETGVETVLRNS
jgi:hypothetical protein